MPPCIPPPSPSARWPTCTTGPAPTTRPRRSPTSPGSSTCDRAGASPTSAPAPASSRGSWCRPAPTSTRSNRSTGCATSWCARRRGSPCTPPPQRRCRSGRASLDGGHRRSGGPLVRTGVGRRAGAHAQTGRRDRRRLQRARPHPARAGRDLGGPRAGGRRRAVLRQRPVAGAARGVRRLVDGGCRPLPVGLRAHPRRGARPGPLARADQRARHGATATGCWPASRRCSRASPTRWPSACTTEVTLWRRAGRG